MVEDFESTAKPISTDEGIQLAKRIGAVAYLEWDSEAPFKFHDAGVAEIAGAIAWAANNTRNQGAVKPDTMEGPGCVIA